VQGTCAQVPFQTSLSTKYNGKTNRKGYKCMNTQKQIALCCSVHQRDINLRSLGYSSAWLCHFFGKNYKSRKKYHFNL